MAYIKIQDTDNKITNQEEVAQFLSAQEVIYEQWDMAKLPQELHEKYDLTDAEKESILAAFGTDIKAISDRRGYKAADIISLSDANPKLDEMLKNFERKHIHTDDEVRFIVSGHSVFIIQGKDEKFFEVHLEAGDLISVPENTTHYFTLDEDRKTVAIRLFITTEGWVPLYADENAKA